MAPLRIPTPLSDDLEDLVQRTIGACIAVHAELGPGLLEEIYSRAIAAELLSLGIGFEREHSLPINYRGALIGHHRLDLLVEGQIVLEVKAVERLLPVHVAQVISYLKVSRARIGLLMNLTRKSCVVACDELFFSLVAVCLRDLRVFVAMNESFVTFVSSWQ
jgi:GxxExxY protein